LGEPPSRAANAEEWLDFFQGKRRPTQANLALGTGGLAGLNSLAEAAAAGFAGNRILRSKLKPLRSARLLQQATVADKVEGTGFQKPLSENPDGLSARQSSSRPAWLSARTAPRLQELDLGLELAVSGMPKFKRAAALIKSKNELISRLLDGPQGEKDEKPSRRALIVSQSDDELIAPPDGPSPQSMAPAAPQSERASRVTAGVAASRWNMAVGDLQGDTSSGGASKEKKDKQVRNLPTLWQMTSEKLAAAGKKVETGPEVKLMIDHKLHNVVKHGQQVQPSPGEPALAHSNSPPVPLKTPIFFGSESRSSSKSNGGDDVDSDKLCIAGHEIGHGQLKKDAVEVRFQASVSDLQMVERSNQESGECFDEQTSPTAKKQLIEGTGLRHEELQELTDEALLPTRFTEKHSVVARGRSSATNLVGPLISRVREHLEVHYGSVAAAWVCIESNSEGDLTLGGLQRGMVQAGVTPDDAGHLLQAIIENQRGQAAAAIPGDRAPARGDFMGALLPGKLPQAALDAANRRSSGGSAWWSEGRISPNFRLSVVQDGVSSRDANTILSARQPRDHLT
jgi:hypothetical protein